MIRYLQSEICFFVKFTVAKHSRCKHARCSDIQSKRVSLFTSLPLVNLFINAHKRTLPTNIESSVSLFQSPPIAFATYCYTQERFLESVKRSWRSMAVESESLFELYHEYKDATKYVLDWLWSTSALRASVPKDTRTPTTQDIIDAALLVSRKSK